MKSGPLVSVLVILMFLVQVQQGSAQLFTCWGGCLNECFILNKRAIGRFPCYVNCLAKCFSPPPGSVSGSGSPPNAESPPSPLQGPAPSPSEVEADLDLDIGANADAYGSPVISTTSEIYPSQLHKRKYCIFECALQTCGLHNHGMFSYIF